MKAELQKKLKADYPKIFAQCGKKESRLPIGWGIECGDGWYELISRACHLIQHHVDSNADMRKWAEDHNRIILNARDSDFTLFDEKYKDHKDRAWVDGLRDCTAAGHEKLREVPEEIKQPIAAQVKEKFGALRFYMNGGDDYAYGVVEMAASMSALICEQCGAKGTLGTHGGSGWVYTACKKHSNRHKVDKWYDDTQPETEE